MGIVVRVQTHDRKPTRSPAGHKRRGHNRFYNFLFQLERDDLEFSDDVQAVLDAGGRVAGWQLKVGGPTDLEDGGDPAHIILSRTPWELRQVDARRLLAVAIRIVEVEEEYV